ncbi:ATP-dependent DNA helicase chl1 [Rhizina undulata]
MMEQRNFHHPYQPYQIQLDFMNAVYSTLEDGCVGIFESPTGTFLNLDSRGKSLSLICGSLTWLRDYKKRQLEGQFDDDEEDDGEPAWVKEYAKQDKKQQLLQARAELEGKLAKIREKEKKERKLAENGGRAHKAKIRKVETEVEIEEDDVSQFDLNDYESDEESENLARANNNSAGFSPAVLELMKKLGLPTGNEEKEDMELPDEMKIFFCSRTHSQLTQFINELRKVKILPSFSEETLSFEEEIKHLSLGSRKNLCINPKVIKLGNTTAINERCLELQQSGTSPDCRCQFLPGKDDQVAFRDFRDHTLAKIRDIEDLASLGKKIGVCPYYASRPTIKPSEIVTLPYPLLLQKSARQALDLSLKGHVVIIDEAHNLIDAITSIHSIIVTLSQLKRSRAQIDIYLGKFKNRLKGKNKVYVMQTVRLLEGLAAYLEDLGKKDVEGTVAAGDLLSAKGIDQVNVFKLQRYLMASKLARKVEGYIIHTEQQKEQQQPKGKLGGKTPIVSIPVLTHLQGFLLALTNPSAEGKIFHGKTENKKDYYFKYMLLNPAHHFKEIVEEARAVILAGGTMEPMSDYMTHLFPYLPKEKIRTLSCGHVIPKENMLAWPIAKGPSGRNFEFTFEKRMDAAMIDDLGRAIINICLAIPHGVVCFFPSYAYLDFVVSQWQKISGPNVRSIWERLQQRKMVFRESSETSSVEEILREYASAIDIGKGGLLLSVVGGKMSEGINFNDNLGRGVIMIGLPFPNVHSAEWKAKLEHVEKVAYDSFVPDSKSVASEAAARKAFAKAAGVEFYENACMRAVNQSIGRAIRHRQDYAVIALFDRRYSSTRITSKLPKWIQSSLVQESAERPFMDVMRGITMYFKAKNAL